jgi:hypothetical protein
MNWPLKPMVSSGSYPLEDGSSDSAWVKRMLTRAPVTRTALAPKAKVAGLRDDQLGRDGGAGQHGEGGPVASARWRGGYRDFSQVSQ